MIKITKKTSMYLLWVLIGILYFPVYLVAWLLRIVARILLAIAYFGTLNKEMGLRVLNSIFSFTYEQTF